MIGIRTPVTKKRDRESPKTPDETEGAGGSPLQTQPSNVRRSIGEWESVKDRTVILSEETTQGKSKTPKEPKYFSRIMEGRACLQRAKSQLNALRNLKLEIKTEVIQILDRMYQLIKESDNDTKVKSSNIEEVRTSIDAPTPSNSCVNIGKEIELTKKIEEHSKLLIKNSRYLENLKEEICKLNFANVTDTEAENIKQEEMLKILDKKMEKMTAKIENKIHTKVSGLKISYAEMAARPKAYQTETKLHSVIVSSEDDRDTSGSVIEKIRLAVDAKSSGYKIDRVRKARDQKVIIGCRSKEEIEEVTTRILTNKSLKVETATNKDPLIIVKNVLTVNTDDDIIKAIKSQNKHLLNGIADSEIRAEVRYRRKTRNPHLNHVILRVSSVLWRRLTEALYIHVDIQRVPVEDMSPLVQCTRCLGYGHGRRQCVELEDLCSHCGGPHQRSQCELWLKGELPSCRNCVRAKVEDSAHNCFDSECTIRKKWDAIARSSVAYC